MSDKLIFNKRALVVDGIGECKEYRQIVLPAQTAVRKLRRRECDENWELEVVGGPMDGLRFVGSVDKHQ
jgi:hypothetical protein